MLCSIGVFNASLMNDAIFKFKRYEDASLSYTGIDKHEGKDVGGWDTVIKREEYQQLFYNQQATMEYTMPVSAPSVVREPAVSYGSKSETKITMSVQQGSNQHPVSSAPKPQQRSVLGQYGTSAASPATPKTPEPSVADTQKEIDRLTALVKEGVSVHHKSFGDGTVANIDKAKKHIRVKFAVGEKNFIFPDAFLNSMIRTIMIRLWRS